jgi:hypothetical protein
MHMPKILETLRRPLFDEQDRDLKLESSDPDELLPDGTLRKGKKRIPRVRATTEVHSYFAIHAPWLLNHWKKTHIRLLGLNLEEWSKQAMRLREIADVAARSQTGSAFGVDWTVIDSEQQDREIAAFRRLFKQGEIKNSVKVKHKEVAVVSHSSKTSLSDLNSRWRDRPVPLFLILFLKRRILWKTMITSTRTQTPSPRFSHPRKT